MKKDKKNSEKTNLSNGPMSFVPGKNVNAHRYFDTDLKMMLQKQYGWQDYDPFAYHYDALLRTGRAYLAWGRPEMKEGILACFRKFQMINLGNKYWYQGARSVNRYQEDDVSRDQLSGAFYALLVRGDKEECLELIRHTPYRISRRFIMSPDFWLWTKAVQGKKWAEVLWHVSNIITLPIMLHILNRFLNLCLGYKEVPQREYSAIKVLEKKKKFNKIQRLLDQCFYPTYATHHVCWYLECVPNTFLKRCVQKIILWQVEKGNYVERLLCGDRTVTQSEVDSYVTMTEYRWAGRLDGNSTEGIIPEAWDTDMIEKLKVNQLDRDMLLWLWEKKKAEWRTK